MPKWAARHSQFRTFGVAFCFLATCLLLLTACGTFEIGVVRTPTPGKAVSATSTRAPVPTPYPTSTPYPTNTPPSMPPVLPAFHCPVPFYWRGPDLARAYDFLLSLYYEPKKLFRIDLVEHKIYPYGAIHAVKLFQQTDPELAEEISEGLAAYGLDLRNGEFETYFGEVVGIPFLARLPRVLEEFEDDAGNGWQVVIDEARSEHPMYNWEEYASLLLYGSLSRFNEGETEEAHRLFDDAMKMWDGTGFFDRYVREEDRYASYVIALALYTSRAIDRPIPCSQLLEMNRQLRRCQYENGGIATLYERDGKPFGTSADEPTILTILGYIGLHPGDVPDGRGIPTAVPKERVEAPLAACMVGWYGYDTVTGDCEGGIGSYHWNDTPNTAGVVHTPELGFYCSSDPAVVAWQLEQMEEARVQVVLFSWWGWGDRDLDGLIEGHADMNVGKALAELLRQIKASQSKMKVAVIVEPFTVPQASVSPDELTLYQKGMVLDHLWEEYYSMYPSQMFPWEGKPLVIAFDPMRLPDDPRFTVRHWTGRARDEETIGEGWQWFFAPPQDAMEGRSDDGVVFVYPRFDEYYAELFGADYFTWKPRRVDPCLSERTYECQWRQLLERRDQVELIIVYGWNLYGEQAQIEPSTGACGPVGYEYVRKTRDYYEAFVQGLDVLPIESAD